MFLYILHSWSDRSIKAPLFTPTDQWPEPILTPDSWNILYNTNWSSSMMSGKFSILWQSIRGNIPFSVRALCISHICCECRGLRPWGKMLSCEFNAKLVHFCGTNVHVVKLTNMRCLRVLGVLGVTTLKQWSGFKRSLKYGERQKYSNYKITKFITYPNTSKGLKWNCLVFGN